MGKLDRIDLSLKENLLLLSFVYSHESLRFESSSQRAGYGLVRTPCKEHSGKEQEAGVASERDLIKIYCRGKALEEEYKSEGG